MEEVTVSTDALVKMLAIHLERLPTMTPRERDLFADALDLLIHPPMYSVNGNSGEVRMIHTDPRA